MAIPFPPQILGTKLKKKTGLCKHFNTKQFEFICRMGLKTKPSSQDDEIITETCCVQKVCC